MVRAKALTDAEIASGVGRTKPIASKSVLEQSRSGLGSRGLTVVSATDNKNYIIPKALVRELSRTWDQVLAAKDTGFITIDDGPLTVQFVLEWMKCGGCDNPATNALQYPAGSQKKLECLGRLAGRLGIDELVKRVNTDLEIIKATALKVPAINTAPQAAQAQKVGHGRRDAGKPALEARNSGAARQAEQGQLAKRGKATSTKKGEPRAEKEIPSAQGRPPKDGKRQPKKRSCKKCGDPRHYQSKCPVGWSDATDGAWKFVPRRPRPFPAKAGAVGDEQSAKPGTAMDGKRTTRQPAEPLEHTAGDIDNFQLMDQNGITWFVPWYKLKVRFETVPGSGKVRMVGDAPLEYSWIPADLADGNGATPDSDSSHKA